MVNGSFGLHPVISVSPYSTFTGRQKIGKVGSKLPFAAASPDDRWRYQNQHLKQSCENAPSNDIFSTSPVDPPETAP
jgi:hypothetical protein